ncbi:MAG: cytochrome c-type biogenesis protein CcmH [Pseudomonadota bacterium]|nr:cytochrome c-type biogenesis protein CcmH [Pseudomonadota bacterium]
MTDVARPARAAASFTLIASLALALCAGATKMDVPADAAFDLRIRTLESELRCLVCQNQTLADSNASLAEDLRREVRALAIAGKNDGEIRAYLVARYGDFVLYDPPLKRTTWLLWIGPFALLVGGAALWWVVLRRRNKMPLAVDASTSAADPGAEARGRSLLGDPQDPSDKP